MIGTSAPRHDINLGAKFGAIPCGSAWTALDSGGTESPWLRGLSTRVDVPGHGLEIYGSAGWVFESPRAR